MRTLLAFLLMIVVTLSACRLTERVPGSAPVDADGSVDQDKTTISFAARDNQREMYETLAARFMQDHPDIRVVIVSSDEIYNTANQSDSRAPLDRLRRIVSGADTAPLGDYVTPAAYSTDLLYDIAPLIDADPSFETDDFYPGALERFSTADGTWVLPKSFSLPILYYNKDLFEQANLPEPAGDWTWEELLSSAEQLASKYGDEVDTYGFAEQSEGLNPLLLLLQAQQIDLLQTPVETWQFEQPEVAAVVDRMHLFLDSGAVGFSPIPPGMYDLDEPLWPQDWIIEGRVGMWSSTYSWQVRNRGDGIEQVTPDFAVGTVPYPAGSANLFRGRAEGYIISGGTAHPNEAWQWIEFLSRQQTEQLIFGDNPIASHQRRVPARRSLAEESHFWDRLDAEERITYEQALQNMADSATVPAVTKNVVSAVFHSLYEALLNAVADNTSDIDSELSNAQSQLQEWIAQEQREPEPNLQPVVVATPPPQDLLPGTTLVRFGVPTYQMGRIRQLVESFQQQHPDITVRIIPLDTHTGSVDFPAAAQATDCFSWSRPPETVQELEALADLQPLIDADATFPRDDYLPALLTSYQRDGQLYGLPQAFTIRMLYYNLTEFRTVGLEPPAAEWTPTDFLTAAQALTHGDGPTKQYGYVPTSSIYSDLLFFISQFGADLTRGSGADIRPNFDDPEVVAAIQWYIDLYKIHEVMPEPRLGDSPSETDESGDDSSAEGLIEPGNVGMWFDWTYDDMQLPQAMDADDTQSSETTDSVAPAQTGVADTGDTPPIDFELGFAPMPIGNVGLTTGDFSVRGLHMSAQPQNPDACWEWMTFLANDVSNLRNEIPARLSLMTAPEFAEQSSHAAAAIELYDTALQQPSQPGTNSDVFGTLDPYWFFQAIDEAMQGTTDLETSLSEAQETSIAYLECLNANEDPDAAACANQVDPEY